MVQNADWWAAVFCSAFVFVLTGSALLLAYESWALFTNHEPITFIVRTEERAHPRWVGLVLMIFCLLLGHFARF